MADADIAAIESTGAYALFPTLVWESVLGAETRQLINAPILQHIVQLRQALPLLGPGESWQSGNQMQEQAAFKPLMAIILERAAAVLEFLKIGGETLQVTGCWVNVSARGAGHKLHSHPNNFLSGVYYVQTASGADTINFHDPRIQAGIIRPPVRALTGENADQAVVQVKDGLFLLFPSWLQHSVDASQSDSHRISVSFNLMFSAYVQRMSRPLW